VHQYLSIIHYNKMTVNDVSFCQHAVTEFFIGENNSAEISFIFFVISMRILALVTAVCNGEYTLKKWQ
jgi:hypothetical protein